MMTTALGRPSPADALARMDEALFKRRLAETMEAMEAALLADDEARAARAVESDYDIAAAVPAGVVYPDGTL